MRSAYFLAARAVVNAEDPAGLLAMDAPDDGYDSQVEALIRWRQPVTPTQVAEVFDRWLGPDWTLPDEVAERIARGINVARSVHLPDSG